jgi:hypothetical protein
MTVLQVINGIVMRNLPVFPLVHVSQHDVTLAEVRPLAAATPSRKAAPACRRGPGGFRLVRSARNERHHCEQHTCA